MEQSFRFLLHLAASALLWDYNMILNTCIACIFILEISYQRTQLQGKNRLLFPFYLFCFSFLSFSYSNLFLSYSKKNLFLFCCWPFQFSKKIRGFNYETVRIPKKSKTKKQESKMKFKVKIIEKVKNQRLHSNALMVKRSLSKTGCILAES